MTLEEDLATVREYGVYVKAALDGPASAFFDALDNVVSEIRGLHEQGREQAKAWGLVTDQLKAEKRGLQAELRRLKAEAEVMRDILVGEWGWDVLDDVKERADALVDPEHLHKFGEHGTCECGATPGWPDVPNQSAEESG